MTKIRRVFASIVCLFFLFAQGSLHENDLSGTAIDTDESQDKERLDDSNDSSKYEDIVEPDSGSMQNENEDTMIQPDSDSVQNENQDTMAQPDTENENQDDARMQSDSTLIENGDTETQSGSDSKHEMQEPDLDDDPLSTPSHDDPLTTPLLDDPSTTPPPDEEPPVDEEEEEEIAKGIVDEATELIASLHFESKARGYELLMSAASQGNSNAKEMLAYGYMFGTVLARNFTKSLEIFQDLADNGYSSGQRGLGLLYSTGIRVNSSQAKAVLYYTFGALGDHPLAQMSMGYRSYHGVGVPQSCETALSYYSKVAERVADAASLFAGGHAVQKARLTDSDEEPSTIFAGVTEDELEHYRDVFADTGAQFSLGLYYLFGLGGVERNLPQALELLKKVDTAAALALIGRIYAEGSPPQVPQDNDTAIEYFRKAIEENNGEGYAGLGIMYFRGMGVKQDYSKALELFKKGSDKGSNEASLYIGLINLFGLGVPENPAKALASFKAAAQGGHILSYFYMAEIYSGGLAGRRSCKQAVELYKVVAERGKWSRLLREAHKLYLTGDVDSSLMMYLHLAELGIEVAQSNAAFILHEGSSSLLSKNESLKRALLLWSRSAVQGYSVARVMLGDYYYYGYGTDQDMELAVDQYRTASDRLLNPQAMFNLGYMYENGIGLEQDFHLAHRYYDLAAATNADAAIPVYLALLKMNLMSYWHVFKEQVASPEKIESMFCSLWTLLDDWDIYLISVLCVVLAIAVRYHRRQ